MASQRRKPPRASSLNCSSGVGFVVVGGLKASGDT